MVDKEDSILLCLTPDDFASLGRHLAGRRLNDIEITKIIVDTGVRQNKTFCEIEDKLIFFINTDQTYQPVLH